MSHIIVGSKNPVKIEATHSGFAQVFPHTSFRVSAEEVASGVANQPFGDAETLEGARNRARNAKAMHPTANFWVGLEGGVAAHKEGMEVFAWMCILSNMPPYEGIARTASFFLPPQVTQLVNQGMELGKADDLIFQKRNSKQGQGSVGILTHGIIDRATYYQPAIVLALIPFVNPELYGVES